MTGTDIVMAIVGFIICAAIVSSIGVLIMLVIWHAFKTDMDTMIDTEEWEEEV